MNYDTYCNDCYYNDCYGVEAEEAVEKLVETLNCLICESLMRDIEEAVKKQVETLNGLIREGLMRDIDATIDMMNQSIHVLLALGGLTDQEVSELRGAESYLLMAQDAMKRVMNTLPDY